MTSSTFFRVTFLGILSAVFFWGVLMVVDAKKRMERKLQPFFTCIPTVRAPTPNDSSSYLSSFFPPGSSTCGKQKFKEHSLIVSNPKWTNLINSWLTDVWRLLGSCYLVVMKQSPGTTCLNLLSFLAWIFFHSWEAWINVKIVWNLPPLWTNKRHWVKR